ncbi:MAG: hypothetical protein DID92_2727745144 [Candidatus Nitrotoga sp. SPKER]|nr:MAG: hypothetical protein DID92_2727745144 [Candidatus Nitrotoga sp. SPKER]
MSYELHFARCAPLTRLRLEHHVEYIHYNPVKHEYVASPWEWPHSSFLRYVEAGVYEAGWGQGQINFEDVEYA